MLAIKSRRIQEIVDLLNGYLGDDEWESIILHLDEYDPDATEVISRGAFDRFALADGTVIAWDARSRWYEEF